MTSKEMTFAAQLFKEALTLYETTGQSPLELLESVGDLERDNLNLSNETSCLQEDNKSLQEEIRDLERELRDAHDA